MSEIRPFEQIDPGDTDAVGGKGLSLGLMTRAGLPVPPGFCITSAAHRRLRGQQPHNDDALARAILDAYHQLGGGPVAVRSSATAEDSSLNSFAGQQETILGVVGDKRALVPTRASPSTERRPRGGPCRRRRQGWFPAGRQSC